MTTTTTNSDNTLLAQVECDTRLAACPAGANYPPQTGVHLEPMPQGLPTMANPCAGVPSNAWCSSSGSSARPRPGRRHGALRRPQLAVAAAYRRAGA